MAQRFLTLCILTACLTLSPQVLAQGGPPGPPRPPGPPAPTPAPGPVVVDTTAVDVYAVLTALGLDEKEKRQVLEALHKLRPLAQKVARGQELSPKEIQSALETIESSVMPLLDKDQKATLKELGGLSQISKSLSQGQNPMNLTGKNEKQSLSQIKFMLSAVGKNNSSANGSIKRILELQKQMTGLQTLHSQELMSATMNGESNTQIERRLKQYRKERGNFENQLKKEQSRLTGNLSKKQKAVAVSLGLLR